MSLPIKARSCHKAAPPVIEVAAGAAIAPALDWIFSTLGQSSWLPAGCPALYSENVICFTRSSYSSHVLHRRAAQRTIVDGSGILLSCWTVVFFCFASQGCSRNCSGHFSLFCSHTLYMRIPIAVCIGPPMYKAVMQNSCGVNAAWCESHVVYRASGVNASAVKAAWCPRLRFWCTSIAGVGRTCVCVWVL